MTEIKIVAGLCKCGQLLNNRLSQVDGTDDIWMIHSVCDKCNMSFCISKVVY